MYAVIETGGKQFSVSMGDEIRVEKLQGDLGEDVNFTEVISVSLEDGTLQTGDEASKAQVTGIILNQGRGKKVDVLKFKRRKMYRRRNGHRQDYTQVRITSITVS